MVLEEYDPELVYIKGPDNVVADALSRLDLLSDEENLFTEANYLEWLSMEQEDLSPDCHPLRWSLIAREQAKDSRLQKAAEKFKDYHVKTIRGGDKEFKLIHYKNKVVIPQSLQTRIATWYHEWLMHPGINRTEQTIRQHFTWPSLTADVTKLVNTCQTCQKTKKNKRKMGHLPPKKAEVEPWDVLCVDLIGPYRIRRKGKKDLILHCLTMIDPATGWFETRQESRQHL